MAKLDKTFKVGQTVVCRVLNYSKIDGIANSTMKQSQIEERFIRYEDIEVGSLVTGKIVTVHEKGMEVKLASSVKAFCPRVHLADSAVSDPVSRFKVGAEATCRVLSVDPALRRAIVTNKKSLVQSDDIPMLSAYEDAEPDQITRGYIIAVKDFGCVVAFLNNVKGKVSLNELATTYVSDPTKMFRVGQVVSCRVISADAAKERLRLSFNLAKSKTQAEQERLQELLDGFARESSLVSAIVTATSTRGADVKLSDELSGFVPLVHMSDHRLHCANVNKSLKVGQKLELLVVKRGKATEAKKITLSMKPALIQAYKDSKFPSSFENVAKGSTYVGFVKKIVSFGVFVSFGNNLVGLAPKNALADLFVPNAADFFFVGQTVTALVTETFPERSEFVISIRPSQVGSSAALFLESLLKETAAYTKKKEGVNFKPYSVGSVVSLSVVRKAEYGLLLESEDAARLTAVAVTQQVPASASSAAPGTSFKGVVLDVDFAKGILDVSLRQELVSAASAVVSASGTKLQSEGKPLKAVVELVKGNYALLSTVVRRGILFLLFCFCGTDETVSSIPNEDQNNRKGIPVADPHLFSSLLFCTILSHFLTMQLICRLERACSFRTFLRRNSTPLSTPSPLRTFPFSKK